MKKINKNRFLRALCFLLAIAMGTLSVVGSVATLICYQNNMYENLSKQEILKQKYTQFQERYELQIMSEIRDGVANEDLSDISNFTYQVKKETTQDKDAEQTGHVYSLNDQFEHFTPDGIIWNMLFHNRFFMSGGDDTETQISTVNDIVLNSTENIMYYRTGQGQYFPVEELRIPAEFGALKQSGTATDFSYLTYSLSHDKKAYICDDDNYESTPNLKNYAAWTVASFDGVTLYTPCILTKALQKNLLEQTKKIFQLSYQNDEDELMDDELWFISSATEMASNHVTTHDGIKSLIPMGLDICIEVTIPVQKYVITSEVASPLDMGQSDLFVKSTQIIQALYPNRFIILYGTFFACLLFIVSVILCCRYTLRIKPKTEDGEDTPSGLARVPLLLYWAVTGGILSLLICFFSYVFSEWMCNSQRIFNMEMLLLIEILIVGFAIGMHILVNFCTRIRTKTLLRYTLCYYISKPFGRLMQRLRQQRKQANEFIVSHSSLLVRVGIVWGILSVLQLIVIGWTEYDFYAEIILFFLYKSVEAIFVMLMINQFSQIAKGGKQLGEGDLSKKLDTSKLFGPFKRHAVHLNQISDGIQIAVQERMKSEHFKTELITNVTHDIKTPLTSIINYVDLLRTENITDEERSQYLDVLDRQSARLKKLIEDLIEASKASTGNLSVYLEPCDLEILLTQTLGEFEEKLSANQLELIIRNITNSATEESMPESSSIVINADNRHLWRIFDNLMNNICKYAQPNTRVYIDLRVEKNQAEIIFRNTSRYPLNMDGEALMERFVRGDASRNTEGNGLGLSIAKNLAELMNGTLTLYVDGDLFKVIIRFPIKE